MHHGIIAAGAAAILLAGAAPAAAQQVNWDDIVRQARENVGLMCNGAAADPDMCRMARDTLQLSEKMRAEQDGAPAATADVPATATGSAGGATAPQRVSGGGVTFTHRGHWNTPGDSGARLYTVELVNEGARNMRCSVNAYGQRYNVGGFTGAGSVQSAFSERSTVFVFAGKSGSAAWEAVVPGTARYTVDCVPA